MKKIVLAFLLISLLALFLVPNLYAYPVKFTTADYHAWARAYDLSTGTGVARVGLDTANQGLPGGHSFDNPYPPGTIPTGNMTQNLAPNVYTPPDGTEDYFGVAQIEKIAEVLVPSNELWNRTATGHEVSTFFHAGDDVLITSGTIPSLSPAVYSLGVNVEFWYDTTPDFDVTQGTAGRDPAGVDPTYYNTVAGDGDPNATHLMTLTGHTKFIDVDGDSIFTAGIDDLDGSGNPNLYDQVSTSIGPLFTPPFTFSSNILLDVQDVNGDGKIDAADGAWAWMYDTNTIFDGQGGFADFSIAASIFDNRPSAGGFGIGGIEAGSDADDMWSYYDNLTVVGDVVPEPATMLLLGSGLIGLAGFGRKKKFFKKS